MNGMGEWMDGYLARLAQVRQANLAGGGPERLEKQHDRGKLTARERRDRLVDPGSFEEIGSVVVDHRPPFDGRQRPSPSDGVVMGLAKIDGRPAAVWSLDFTVMSGSLGDQAAWKLSDLTVMAGQRRMPIVGLIDSAGQRLSFKGGDTGLNGVATFLKNYAQYSGVIPRVALVLGPCVGLLTQVAVLSDFLIMSAQPGFMWLGGEIASVDAGRAEFHMDRAGQVDLIAADDEEAIAQAKAILNFLPTSCWDIPPFVASDDPWDRREEGLLNVLPDDPKFTYDIHEVIDLIVDDGQFFELKEDYAPNLVIGFARFGGHVAGIVANNPDELSGILEPDSSDKYDRFMNFLDCFSIPMVNIVDTTAFPPGDRWERQGVIRHGAKLLHSYSHVTGPKVTMVLRRSYGGANIVMGCSKMFPDYVYAWPTVEFAPTGPETVVHAVFHKELAAAKESGTYEQTYDALLGMLKEQFAVLNLARHWTTYYTAHEVIDPRDTRPRIVRAIESLRHKVEDLPDKRRSIKPA